MKVHNKLIRKVCIIVLVVAAVLAVGAFSVSRVAESKLRSALADVPGLKIDFKRLHISPIAGNVVIRDVEIALRDSTTANPDIEGRIGAIKLEGLRWRSLFHGEAHARRLLIQKPDARLVLTGQAQKEKKDTAAQSSEPSFLKVVSLSEVRLEKGKIGLSSLKDSLKASAEGIDFSLRDIAIQLADGQVQYNDSTYRMSVDSLDYTDAPGLSRIRVGHLATADAGPVEVQAMHMYNCVPQEQLALKMGKVAVMWYDVKLDSLYTSPLNIPRMAKSQRIEVDNVYLSSPEIVILQDDRFPPAVPYPTIQESLNSLALPLQINQINARIKAFTFIWETTHVNRGTFPLSNVRLAINSVSNAHNNVMDLGIKSGTKTNGYLDLSLKIRNDKEESIHGKMLISGLDATRLDSFLRPLFGATAKATIEKIDCSFKGNKHQMTDDFCMIYSDLSLHAWDDTNAPYQFVAKGSGVVNFLANLVIPKSNPSHPGKDPKKVEVTFERDPQQPYPAYIIQNLTMGMLRTVLPGGSVRKTNQKTNQKK